MPVSEKIYSREAKEFVRKGTTLKAGQLTVEQIPPVAISWTTTRQFLTGSWSHVRPRFQRLLAPCREGCPVSEDIEEVMHRVELEDWTGAWRTIIRENPLPAVCGRVCFHPCETACNRSQFDQAVGIHYIEREVGDFGLKKRLSIPGLPRKKSKYNIAVVGSGPAGLAACYHLSLLGHQVILFESHPQLGGLLRWGIPDFRLPTPVLDAEIQRILDLGVQPHTGIPVGTDPTLNKLRATMDAVFIATGAAKSHRLALQNEDAPSVLPGLSFLNHINANLPPEVGKEVLVVGGGNTAIDSARAARRLGANVTIIYRRSRDEMPAYAEEVEEAENEGVEIKFLWSPVKILLADGKVTGLKCVKMRLGKPDASGRPRPVPMEGVEEDFPATTVLNAIGEGIDPETVGGELSPMLSSDEMGRTEIPNVFVGGDFSGATRTVAHALGSGKRAAMLIHQHLNGEDPPHIPDEWKVGEMSGISAATAYRRDPSPVAAPAVAFEQLNTAYFSPANRRRERANITDPPGDFAEVRRGIGPTYAVREAERCFHCGHCNHCGNCFVFCPDGAISVHGFRKLEYDYDHCKGCGVCVEECPRNAIAMDPIK
jgi:2-oxoacid:acceptor oxidoreductase delta subunit (pyruvate/2-ketoisovalerate family)